MISYPYLKRWDQNEKMKNFKMLQIPRFSDGNVVQAKLYTFCKGTKVGDLPN